MLNPNDFEILESIEADDGSKVEIIQFKDLKGSSDLRSAENLFYAKEVGIHLKMVRVFLNNSTIRVEPGALYFMKGNLKMQTSTGGGIAQGLARKIVAGESFFLNEISGTGEIYFEPTFGHFFLHKIEKSEGGVIVDKKLFYAGTTGLDITAAIQKNLSSALWGGEGLFQTRIYGNGIAILCSPVPGQEIIKYELNGEKLYVDGNFALMRSENITFRVEKSSKSWISTSVSGEGMLQTFEGIGFVWIAPTQSIYEKLVYKSLEELTSTKGTSNSKTK
ncbi:MAG: AIM24 family protein [Candidatus Methanofastidiosa archaeon]|nr:AIM24 family protein [Candidatus Methanofastidiosa archaeon]